MVDQALAGFDVGRAVGEQCDLWPELNQSEAVRGYDRLHLKCGKVPNYGFAVVRPARATNFMKVRVQKLLEACATAPQSRVMELDFKCLEFVEQRVHGWNSFVRPNVRAKLPAEACSVSLVCEGAEGAAHQAYAACRSGSA